MNHLQMPSLADGPAAVCPALPAVVATTRVIAALRLARTSLQLPAQVLRTLELLLSLLPPKRNHHMIFASNATLVLRSGGLSERTLRRHIAELSAAGLLDRCDSPNRKRFSRTDPVSGMKLHFGMDLSPLFRRFDAIEALAEIADNLKRHLSYLKTRLRAAAYRLLASDPDNQPAQAALLLARRNCSADELVAMQAELPPVQEVDCTEMNGATASEMSGNDGQNDRQDQNFNEEYIENRSVPDSNALLRHCTEAVSLAPCPIETEADIVSHAYTLAPMIGISTDAIHKANEKSDPLSVAALVWLIVQNMSEIRNPPAYFQAVLFGRKSASFNPWSWLKRQMTKTATIVRGQSSGPWVIAHASLPRIDSM